eukprot:6487917-Amphidinium_carterae.2
MGGCGLGILGLPAGMAARGWSAPPSRPGGPCERTSTWWSWSVGAGAHAHPPPISLVSVDTCEIKFYVRSFAISFKCTISDSCVPP